MQHMTLKVNVNPLAEKNPIGTLCVVIKWQEIVSVVQEKDCFVVKKEHDDQLSRHCKTLKILWAYNTDLRKLN